jgi:UDP-glucuronate 4-epimerase
MRTLVTGSAGFIGFHVAKKLLERGYGVIGIDNFNDYYDVALKESRNRILENFDGYKMYRGNLEDLEFVKSVFKIEAFGKICHLAAQAGVRYSLQNPHAYIRSNITGFTNLIEEAKNSGVKDFIYASSSSVYGSNEKIPFAVSDNVDHPISLYAATKKANELIAHAYHHLYGMNCTGLRYFTVYGPYGRPDMSPFLFANAILEGKPIKVFNFGKCKRDFTYVDDIAFGTIQALEKSYPYDIFNLGNNKPVELEYFIGCLENELGKKAIKNYLPLQPGDVPVTYADIEHSKEKLGFEPFTAIEDGIKEYSKWHLEYYKIDID